MDNPVNVDMVRELLEKYFEGRSSAREERALREYFAAAHELPDDLRYARTLFGYFADTASRKTERRFEIPAPAQSGCDHETPAQTQGGRETEAPAQTQKGRETETPAQTQKGRETETPAQVQEGCETEAPAQMQIEGCSGCEIPQPAGPGRSVLRRRRNRLRIWACATAAAVIAAVAILRVNSAETVYCYINGEPVTDYELAYAYTQGALGLIEDNIRKPGEYLVAAQTDDPFGGLRYLEMLETFADGILLEN